MAESLRPSQVNVRAQGQVAARVGEALGVVLPVEPNTVATRGQRSALWLGPDEWLVVDDGTPADEIEASVRQAFDGDWGSVVDVSANRSLVELSGPRARDVLAKGCSLDLHPRSFRPGMCAQTLLAKTAVILWQTDDTPTFKVFVRASFSAHLARWLADASVEFYFD
jgi:sarcosine oxidase subunit gamma